MKQTRHHGSGGPKGMGRQTHPQVRSGSPAVALSLPWRRWPEAELRFLASTHRPWACIHPGTAKSMCSRGSTIKTSGVCEIPVLLSSAGVHTLLRLTRKAPMDDTLANILSDPNHGLTATSRVILLHLVQCPYGARIEEIAFSTGCKYRWVEAQVSRLTRLEILRRVAPGTYAINADREVQK